MKEDVFGRMTPDTRTVVEQMQAQVTPLRPNADVIQLDRPRGSKDFLPALVYLHGHRRTTKKSLVAYWC